MNILDMLDTSYCVDKAYEYLQYLLNAHEEAHDLEDNLFVL